MDLDLTSIDFTTLLVLCLAAFRITHLMIADVVTAPLRWVFVEEFEEPDKLGRMTSYSLPKMPQWRAFIGILFTCPWCMGFWVSVILVAGWYWFPVIFFPIALVFALSAVAGLFETLIRYWQVNTYSPSDKQLERFEEMKQKFFEKENKNISA